MRTECLWIYICSTGFLQHREPVWVEMRTSAVVISWTVLAGGTSLRSFWICTELLCLTCWSFAGWRRCYLPSELTTATGHCFILNTHTTTSLFGFYLFLRVHPGVAKSITMSCSHIRISHRSYLLPVTEAPSLSSVGELICSKQPSIFSTQLLVKPLLKAICFWPISPGSCGRTERVSVACFFFFLKGRLEGGNSALIWLDLAKIPNQGWSAVLVVSERLMLSLYHGNNLLLKPRKQISYGEDISRRHYGVIRRNISIEHAGQQHWQKGAVVCVGVCVCV